MPSGLSGRYCCSARMLKVTVNITALNSSIATMYCFQLCDARVSGPPIHWNALVQPAGLPAGEAGSMAHFM